MANELAFLTAETDPLSKIRVRGWRGLPVASGCFGSSSLGQPLFSDAKLFDVLESRLEPDAGTGWHANRTLR